MSILAIDTCFSACSAAVHNAATGRISDRFERMETGHAERLVPMIAEVMAEAGLAFSELAAVAVTVGPGSFTGVRIGVSAGRALALAHGLETRAISSLEVMGQVARSELPSDASTSRELIVAMDARRGRLLVQRITAAGPADAPRLATVDEIAAAAAPDCIAVGSGAPLLADAAAKAGRHLAAMLPDLQPMASHMLHMAILRADLLTPLYLRPPDATPATHGSLRRAP